MIQYKMQLSPDEKSVLRGEAGETHRKVLETIVLYGDLFGAIKLVPLDKGVHLVTSFGLGLLVPMFEMMDELIGAGLKTKMPFTLDPRPVDFKNVPAGFLQKLIFKIMYKKQNAYEQQLKLLGLRDEDAFSCACYLEEAGARPSFGDVLSWAESSAIIFANSVVGARTNRNSAVIELLSGILGKTPYFGFLTDEGRKATWLIAVECETIPEAQLLGSAIGIKVVEAVPYIKGLKEHFNGWSQGKIEDYLKNAGAAMASNGSVGLFHIEGVTPEAIIDGERLLLPDCQTYKINDQTLDELEASYPVIWKKPDLKPKLCFIGCPHLSFQELELWIINFEEALAVSQEKSLTCPTVLTAPPGVISKIKQKGLQKRLEKIGGRISALCPLMYMANPLNTKAPILTNSNKLRTYSSARYYRDKDILNMLTQGNSNENF